jgi:hypothetical protein
MGTEYVRDLQGRTRHARDLTGRPDLQILQRALDLT